MLSLLSTGRAKRLLRFKTIASFFGCGLHKSSVFNALTDVRKGRVHAPEVALSLELKLGLVELDISDNFDTIMASIISLRPEDSQRTT